MTPRVRLAAWLLALVSPAAFAAGSANNTPALPALPGPPPSSVTLSINPDGTATWDGEPLSGVPDLRDKLAHKTLQDPKLELDLHFHTVTQLGDSNRETLLEVLELAARYGYVHVQATADGAKLTVLGPNAVDTAPK